MKRSLHFGWRARQPGRVRRLVAITSGLAVGFAYCRAAHRDEERGYPFTAALEWRRAAELFTSFTPLCSHCWQEWERIMHLPRRLAAPVPAEGSRNVDDIPAAA